MAANDLKWFEDFYSKLEQSQHKEQWQNLKPDLKQSFFQKIMPTVMTVGRIPYSCEGVTHPGYSCKAFFVEKFTRCAINCMKISLLASLIPQIWRKRKQLFSGPMQKRLKTLKVIIIRYIRATLWLTIGTCMPFTMVCIVPQHRNPLTFLPQGIRMMTAYGTIPICFGLSVEVPTKMPSYMGFFVSKAISQAWAFLKTHKVVHQSYPLEKHIGFAILAGMIGLVSVKKTRRRAIKKGSGAKAAESSQQAGRTVQDNHQFFYSTTQSIAQSEQVGGQSDD